MKVLFYRYNSICEPDVMEALKELGHSVTEECSEMTNKLVTPEQMLLNVSKKLDAEQFDFVFSINFYPVLAEICNVYHIRYLCWTVDAPILELYSDSLMRPWNRVFLFDYAQYQEFAQVNPGKIFYMPLATNKKRWERVFLHTPKRDFSADVSFVGSLYTEKNPYAELQLPSRMKGYFDGLVAMQEQIYGEYLLEKVLSEEMVREFEEKHLSTYFFPEKSNHNTRGLIAQHYLGSEIAVKERYRILKLLAERFSFDLYTGSAKVDIPANWRGTVSTHSEMPFVFRDSKVNLNLTMRGIRSGIPLRIWDIIGCGGFVLSNYQPELAEYFTFGEDLDVFYDESDLLEKVEYYLVHEKERMEIAQNAYEKTMREHTYVHRLEMMIKLAYQ